MFDDLEVKDVDEAFLGSGQTIVLVNGIWHRVPSWAVSFEELNMVLPYPLDDEDDVWVPKEGYRLSKEDLFMKVEKGEK